MTDIVSGVWGNKTFPITQGVEPGFRPDWYKYSDTLGYPSGWHVGLDIAMPAGTPIYADSYGEVIQDGFSDSFRPYPVWIKTKDNPNTPQDETGYIEIYGHLQAEVVNRGQQVVPGTLLGYSGEQTTLGTTTPDGSGAHLHYELRQPGADTSSGYKAVDPTNWLQGATGFPTNGTPQNGGSGKSGVSLLVDVSKNFLRWGPKKSASVVGAVAADETSGMLAIVGATIIEFAKRLLFVGLGLGLLFFGLNKVLETHTGFSAKGGIKKAAKLVPAGRVASKVAG